MWRVRDPVKGDDHAEFDEGVLDAPVVTVQVRGQVTGKSEINLGASGCLTYVTCFLCVFALCDSSSMQVQRYPGLHVFLSSLSAVFPGQWIVYVAYAYASASVLRWSLAHPLLQANSAKQRVMRQTERHQTLF